MASLLGKVFNLAPIPFVSQKQSSGMGGLSIAGPVGSNRGAALGAMASNGTLFAIIDANSQAVSSATWHLYRKRSGRAATGNTPESRTEVTAHAALDLWNKPNPFFTRQEFTEASNQHHDLVGEMWWVIARNPRSPIPLEMWPVSPDKMEPVPHPTKYLSGYMYKGPDGEDIPLGLDEVIFIRRPNPADMYRGIGPVQSVLMDLDSSKYSAEWNRNFFLNSAEPGGILEIDRRLTDDEFKELRMRWDEQHKGVSRAHRVALLEQAKWVPNSITQKDMQFVELRNVSREVIREAFRFPVPMLGTSEDVNRANAEAAEVVFARWLIVPRLDRIKQALNEELLPLFFPNGAPDVEFDYDSPVPDDRDADNQSIQVRSAAAVALIGAGFDAAETLAALDLPEISWTKPAAPQAPPPPGNPSDPGQGGGGEPGSDDDGGGDPEARTRRLHAHHHPSFPAFLDAADPAPAPNLQPLQDEWEAKLDSLLRDYKEVNENWRTQLLTQIKSMAAAGGLLDLLNLQIDSTNGASILESGMVELAQSAANMVVGEAADQKTKIMPVYPRRQEMSVLAQVVIAQLAAEISLSAGREAVRVSGPGVGADDVVDLVRKHLESLTDARPKDTFGAALTAAQHAARVATLQHAPVEAYYATEVLDKNTCTYCRRINGRWLGNTLAEAEKMYPRAGYIDCEGRSRCRGTIVAVFRPEQSPLEP